MIRLFGSADLHRTTVAMMAIWTAALYVGVELSVSQGVEPILYGDSTGLSRLAVVISAVFWSWLLGSIGLVLSMPLTLCLVVLGQYDDRLEIWTFCSVIDHRSRRSRASSNVFWQVMLTRPKSMLSFS
jgi:predicted PurR-regulated permease PerM